MAIPTTKIPPKVGIWRDPESPVEEFTARLYRCKQFAQRDAVPETK